MAVTSAKKSAAWQSYPAGFVSDAIINALGANDVDLFFFSSGSDLVPLQEALAKADALGRPAPKIVPVMHEIVNLNASIGYAMTSGKPAVTAVHVDAGTLNTGAGLHTIYRGNYPVFMMAGLTPTTLPGTMPGARDAYYFWYQEVPDQEGIVRQFSKWTRRLALHDNPGFLVSRALQVAQAPPGGLSYLTLPREVIMAPTEECTMPTVHQLGLPEPVGLDPEQATRVADLLIHADHPLVILGRSGKNPHAHKAMLQLAELLSLPVAHGEGPDTANFPTMHELFGTGPQVQDADVILVVESAMPYLIGRHEPHPDATVIYISEEPIQARIQTYEYTASHRFHAESARALRGIYGAAAERLTRADEQRFAQRRAELAARKVELNQRMEVRAREASTRSPIDPLWVSYNIGKLAGDTTILLNDACTNAGSVQDYYPASQPGSYFRSGGSAGGWGIGAAVGAKLGAPERDVILAVGDGYYLFGVPDVALWTAVQNDAPFLTVLYQNDGYGTGTTTVRNTYPEGYAAKNKRYEAGIIYPSIDYVAEAKAAGAYAESVSDAADVLQALERGLQTVREGDPAVIVCKLPRLGT